jgi:glycosyltransferase involved in cell wall biosynthesis
MFEDQIALLREKLYNPVRDWAMEQTLKQADVVIAVNDATASLLKEIVDASKVETAHYGVDASRFTPGDPAQSRDIVAVGTLKPRKGFQDLLRAWPSVSSNHPDSKLHIVGSGPLRAQLIEMAAELEITESVNMHGFVPRGQLTDLLTNCRAFVHPTYSEGFPHVRLEAMASGTPVIGTNILGAQEMVRDGQEGVIVDIGAADQLSTAMTHLLEHPKTATEMGERARKRAVSEYEWGQFGTKIHRIYDRLLN